MTKMTEIPPITPLMERFIGTDTASVDVIFNIFTSGIEIYVISWDLLLYHCVEEVCRLGLEPVCPRTPCTSLSTLTYCSLLEFRLSGRSTVTSVHWLLLGFWGNVWNPTFHDLWWSGPETRRRHHGTAAEMSMLTPCASLYVLVPVAMLCAFKTLLNTALHSRRELEYELPSSITATILLCELGKSHYCMCHATESCCYKRGRSINWVGNSKRCFNIFIERIPITEENRAPFHSVVTWHSDLASFSSNAEWT